MPQAKGSSFEDIDAAVNTVKAPKATDKEKRHAGKVFRSDGWQPILWEIHGEQRGVQEEHPWLRHLFLQTHKIVEIFKPKEGLKYQTVLEDFNILDFV